MTSTRISAAIRRALAPWRPLIRVAWIHGPVARNDHTPESDVDLVVVGEVRLLPATPRAS